MGMTTTDTSSVLSFRREGIVLTAVVTTVGAAAGAVVVVLEEVMVEEAVDVGAKQLVARSIESSLLVRLPWVS